MTSISTAILPADIDNMAKWAKFEKVSCGCDRLKLASANLRKFVKAYFPETKFSILTSRFSGGDAIDIKWIDGPSYEQIRLVSSVFEAGYFDVMTDSYNYKEFPCVFGDAKYISLHRELSDEACGLIAQALIDKFGQYFSPSGIKNGEYAFGPYGQHVNTLERNAAIINN